MRVTLRALSVLIAGAYCSAPSYAQTASPSPPGSSVPEVTTREASVTFTSRVNVVSVPVVVRDHEGHVIGNLRKEDFQLFDKGKLQAIGKFSIQKADAPAATDISATTAPPPEDRAAIAPIGTQAKLANRFIAYLVDDIHLKSGDLLNMRKAMNSHLDEALEPTARAAILTTSGVVAAEFTDDREKLHQAINRIQPYTSGIDPQQDCPNISYYLADKLINGTVSLDTSAVNDPQFQRAMSTDEAFATAMGEAGACSGPCIGGQKDQLTGADMCTVNTFTILRTAARLAITYGDQETASALRALRDVVGKLAMMPGARNLVLVSSGFLLTRDHRLDEADLIERAIRANVTVNAIDMRGLFTTIPGGTADHPPPPNLQSGRLIAALATFEMEEAKQADDVLAELADGTGGTFFHNDNGLKEGLARLAARPEFVYLLEYSPLNLKFDGSYHALKVTVKNLEPVTLQARRGYWAPNRAVDEAEQAREDLREAMFSRDELQDIPLELKTQFFKPSAQTAELTVIARLDLKSVRFRKADDRNNNTLTVAAGLFDSNGNLVTGSQRVVELRLRDQTLEAMRNAGINVRENLRAAPGRYVVRVVVRDAEGKAMSARNGGVEIP